jgi:hypothetical protein
MDRTLRLTALSLLLLAGAARADGPTLRLPKPSPAAKTFASVGLTDVTVDYSSPAVKGRKIFGGVVPYGEVWRAGANESTKVTFETEVKIDGKAVPAGTYAFYAIPAEGEWTVILSRNTALWGSNGYQPGDDLLRLQIKPQAIPHRERLAFEILDASDEGATLVLEWDQTRVAVPFKLDTQRTVLANIKAFKGEDWRPYNAAARYLFDAKIEAAEALQLVDRSIQLKEEWQNQWMRAQILAAAGKTKEALASAQKAQELGKKNPQGFFYADDVAKALADWSKK